MEAFYRRPESSDTKGTSVDDTRCVFARGPWRQEHVQTTAQTQKTVGAREIRSNQVDVASVPEEYDWNGEVQPTSRVEPKKF
jgi:hypothetical protein